MISAEQKDFPEKSKKKELDHRLLGGVWRHLAVICLTLAGSVGHHHGGY
jgi:hypothetical protein